MTTFVVDASFAAGWIVADERNPGAEILLQRVKVDGGRVPDLFWHGMRHLLLTIEKQGQSIRGSAETAILDLRRLPIVVLANRADAAVLDLARTYKLSSYDAAYLDLAIHRGLPLATADRRLAAATLAAGVPLLGPYAVPSP